MAFADDVFLRSIKKKNNLNYSLPKFRVSRNISFCQHTQMHRRRKICKMFIYWISKCNQPIIEKIIFILTGFRFQIVFKSFFFFLDIFVNFDNVLSLIYYHNDKYIMSKSFQRTSYFIDSHQYGVSLTVTQCNRLCLIIYYRLLPVTDSRQNFVS